MLIPEANDFRGFDLLSLGVLACDRESLSIRFANARAKGWFGSDIVGCSLTSVIPDLVQSDATQALMEGRAFTLAGEFVPASGRRMAFRLFISPEPLWEDLLLAEVEDITKLKEQEHLLESYSRMVERKTREIQKEQERAEKLLMNIFPYSVLKEFKEFGTTTPSFYDDVSVMFLDFVGFTRMPISKQPKQLITELNEIFSTFDQICEHHCCERIKTIGDAYLAVSGMPTPNPDHAPDITNAAIKILRYLRRRNLNHTVQWTCRIGIHTGSVVGSVVGIRKYIYDVFGDGVNTASRMQSLSESMQITVSERTHEIIRNTIACRCKGEVELKGVERMRIYSVEAADLDETATGAGGALRPADDGKPQSD